jgi:hypothetical protein
VKRYLHKEDGDLHRLRRDLTRAFVKHKAGFDIERGNRKISYKEFAQILVDYGVPCAVSDIDNAIRAEFLQNATPATTRVKNVLRRLKEEHFPNLEIEVILAKEVGVERQ